MPQCTDRLHSDHHPSTAGTNDGTAGGSTADKRSASSRGNNTPAGGGSGGGGAGDKKDGGKFCECWHCEFFGHMSVS